MRIVTGAGPGISRLAKLRVELSKKSRRRLKWFDYYNSQRIRKAPEDNKNS